MAEARSYARQGQFSGRIQAPQAAKAKRQRDKEMVAELKEQNRDLKDRDAQFLAAYKEKIAKEKTARDAVEEARRYSVEAERQQRERNFQLSADFAEQEQKAQNEIFEVFGDLLPELGTLIGEEGKRRKEAEQKNAEAITQKVGLTQKQIKEFRAVTWTADVLASKKFEKLRAQLEAGGMTHKQFLDAMNRQGVWGTAFARYDLIQRAKALPSLVTKAFEDGYEYNGTTLFQAFQGEVAGNNREVVDHFIRETLGRIYEGYNAAFVQKTIGQDIERWQNSLQAKRYEKEQEQASGTIEENLNQTITSNLSGIDSYEASLGACGDDEACRYTIVKRNGIRIAELIKKDMISDKAVDIYLRTQVWNKTLNNGEGGRNAIGEDNRGMGHIIREAIAERDRQTLNQAATRMDMDNLENIQLFHDIKKTIDTMPYDEAHRYTDELLADDTVPHSVKAKLVKYITATDAPQIHKNRQIQKEIDRRIKEGVAITEDMGLNATGETYHKIQTLLAEQNSMAVHDKNFKDTAANWVNGITGRKTDFDTGHKDFPQVTHLLQLRYKELQQIEKKKQGTTRLTDQEIHNKVLKEVEEEWDKGTKGDEAARTGLFRYVPKDGDPTTGEFTEIYKIGVPRVQPKISESHDIFGAGFASQPEAVFTKTHTATLQEGMHKFSKSDWDRGADVARLDPTINSPSQALMEAIIANGHTPPPELVRSADGIGKLLKTSSLYNVPLSNLHKLGEVPYNRDSLETVARIVSGKHEVTSEKGWRWHPVRGGWAEHMGIDLAAEMGAQQFNAHVQMKIINIEYSNGGGHGYTAEFYVGDQRVVMRSLHHQKILAREGQVIPPGGIVALVGSTGGSTGPHMHLEFIIDGKLVDPRSVLGGIPLFEYIGPYWHKNEPNAEDFI